MKIIAQYIFDFRSLTDFFPDFVLNLFPGLADYTRWLTNDLLMLGLILAVIGLSDPGRRRGKWMAMLALMAILALLVPLLLVGAGLLVLAAGCGATIALTWRYRVYEQPDHSLE